jgi:hypothetical protein
LSERASEYSVEVDTLISSRALRFLKSLINLISNHVHLRVLCKKSLEENEMSIVV